MREPSTQDIADSLWGFTGKSRQDGARNSAASAPIAWAESKEPRVYLYGRANTTKLSPIEGLCRSEPPVATTATYCLPSVPR